MNTCKRNIFITDGIAIIIQVTFIFAFLTIFFFLYVSKVEKEEFEKQMNFIVDEIMVDIEDDLSSLINNQDYINNDQLTIVLNGIIDLVEQKIESSSDSSVKKVIEQNKEVKNKAYTMLYRVILFVTVISAFFYLLRFCIPILDDIKESIIAVFFVALTELVFLTFVTARYISADPNKVRKTLGESVKTWIKRNKKIE